MPAVTDLHTAFARTRLDRALTALGLVAALSGPWPGAVSRAEATESDTLAVLDGRVVRRVDIVTRTIFDPPPDRGRGFYSLANRMHVRTRHSTVRGALVFREGGTWSESRRAETERHLRELEFLVPDTVVARPAGADSVDVRVVTRDNWTTSPEFSVESGGGQRYDSFSFIERNFMGLGTSLAVAYRNDVNGISHVLSLDDHELFGTHWSGRFKVSRGTTGHVEAGSVMLPFWAQDAPRTMGADAWRQDVSADLFSQGRAVAHVTGREEQASLLWGAGRVEGGIVERFVASLEVHDRSLGPTVAAPGEVPVFAHPAEDLRVRRLAGEVRLWQPHYIVRRGVDLMDRDEDFDVGGLVALKGGFAPRLLGSTADEGYARAQLNLGCDAGRLGFGTLSGAASSRFRRAPLESEGEVDARWYQKPHDRWTVALAVTGVAGHDMPADFQLTLGGLTGLRAFPVHDLTGTEVWRGNAELRWIGVRDWLRLVSLGAAAFWDAGRAWGVGSADEDWHHDAGFGLRVSLPHSALNVVARFDVAWPIAPSHDGRRGPAYSFGSGQAF